MLAAATASEFAPVLSTRVIQSADELYSLRRQWGAVFDAGGHCNPFARWEWTYHWWRVFGRTDRIVRDQLHILLHSDADGTLRGITPLVRTGVSYGGIGFTKLRNVGAVPGAYLTEMYPYIWSPGYEVPVAQALASELYRHRGDDMWADIMSVPLDRPFGRALAGSYVGAHGAWQPPTPYFPVPLPDTWAALKARLTRNSREYLRQTEKKIARLERAGHACHFEILEDRVAVMEALEEFFTLHAARATLIRDERHPHFHPDHFAREGARQFMRLIARDLAAQNVLQIARFRIDGQTAACRILLPANDELFLFHSGFDPRWKDHNVMAAVTAGCIRRAIDTAGVRIVNLSTNLDRSKSQWRPEEGHLLGNVRLTRSTLGGRGADLVNTNLLRLRTLAKRWRSA